MKKYYWHLHHMQLFEEEVEPVEQRIRFIKTSKPKDEIETRLRLIAVVKNQALLRRLTRYIRNLRQAEDAIYKKYEHPSGVTREEEAVKMEELAGARRAYELAELRAKPLIEALHKKECPNCPWDGRTIFPGKNIY